MAKVIPFPSKNPEQEVFYIEIQPESNTQPRIILNYQTDKGVVESELTVLSLS